MSEENEIKYDVIVDYVVGEINIKRYYHPELFLQLWRKQLITGFTFYRNNILYIKTGIEVGGKGEEKEVPASTVLFDIAEEALGITISNTTLSSTQIVIGEFKGDTKALLKGAGRIIKLKRR